MFLRAMFLRASFLRASFLRPKFLRPRSLRTRFPRTRFPRTRFPRTRFPRTRFPRTRFLRTRFLRTRFLRTKFPRCLPTARSPNLARNSAPNSAIGARPGKSASKACSPRFPEPPPERARRGSSSAKPSPPSKLLLPSPLRPIVFLLNPLLLNTKRPWKNSCVRSPAWPPPPSPQTRAAKCSFISPRRPRPHGPRTPSSVSKLETRLVPPSALKYRSAPPSVLNSSHDCSPRPPRKHWPNHHLRLRPCRRRCRPRLVTVA